MKNLSPRSTGIVVPLKIASSRKPKEEKRRNLAADPKVVLIYIDDSYRVKIAGVKDVHIGCQKPITYDQFARQLTDLVTKIYSNSSITVDSLAQKMCMSSSQFHRKVIAVTGLSPMKFVRQIRLSKAKQLLIESHETISSIAYKIGYNDPAYFSRIFKKEFELTPLQWRTEQRQS